MRSSTATLPTSRQLWSPDYYRQHESDTYFDLYHTIDSGMHELHRVFYHMPTYHFDDDTKDEVNQVLTCFAFDMLTRGRTEMHALLSNHVRQQCGNDLGRIANELTSVQEQVSNIANAFSVMRMSKSSSDMHDLKLVGIKKKFDDNMKFMKSKMKELSDQSRQIEEREKEQDDVGSDRRMSRKEKRIELDDIDKEIKRMEKKIERAKNDVINHYESCIILKGCINDKPDKIALDIPSDLVRDKSIQLTANIIGWLKSNPLDYALVIPYIERISADYDDKTGLQWDDFPSTRNEWKPKDPSSLLDSDRLIEYKTQSSKLYDHLTSQLSEGIVKRHLLLRSYGLYQTVSRRGYAGDGVTLYWCLLAMFKPTGAAYREKLEDAMNAMHTFFTSRKSPKRIIMAYQSKLAECIALRVKLKYNLTVSKIANALSDIPAYSTSMWKYLQGTDNPEDCVGMLDSLFNDILYVDHRSVGRKHSRNLAAFAAGLGDERDGECERDGLDPKIFIRKMFEDDEDDSEFRVMDESYLYRSKEHDNIEEHDNIKEHDKVEEHTKHNRARVCMGEECQKRVSIGHDMCKRCVGKGMHRGYVMCKDGSKQIVKKKKKCNDDAHDDDDDLHHKDKKSKT